MDEKWRGRKLVNALLTFAYSKYDIMSRTRNANLCHKTRTLQWKYNAWGLDIYVRGCIGPCVLWEWYPYLYSAAIRFSCLWEGRAVVQFLHVFIIRCLARLCVLRRRAFHCLKPYWLLPLSSCPCCCGVFCIKEKIALPEQSLRFGFLFHGVFVACVDIFGTALPYGRHCAKHDGRKR